MALYGHEIDETTTPFEAGLDWVVKLDKGDFLGRDALAAQKAAGIRSKLVGFEVQGRGIARQGHAVVSEGGAGGRRDQRHLEPDVREGAGARLRAAGAGGAGDAAGDRRPRQGAAGGGGGDPLL